MKDWFKELPKAAQIVIGFFVVAIVLGVLGSLSGCTKPGMVQDVFPHHQSN